MTDMFIVVPHDDEPDESDAEPAADKLERALVIAWDVAADAARLNTVLSRVLDRCVPGWFDTELTDAERELWISVWPLDPPADDAG